MIAQQRLTQLQNYTVTKTTYWCKCFIYPSFFFLINSRVVAESVESLEALQRAHSLNSHFFGFFCMYCFSIDMFLKATTISSILCCSSLLLVKAKLSPSNISYGRKFHTQSFFCSSNTVSLSTKYRYRKIL